MSSYAAFLVFLVAAVGLIGLIVGLNAVLGPRSTSTPAKLEPFECGAEPFQRDNMRPVSIKYYPIAILFLLFDLETVLLFIWASAAGDPAVANLALGSFLAFMALLALAFAWLWRDGGLQWR